MKKLPVTVCLIAGAEAHRLGAALQSVVSWASEIVVVVNEEVTDGTDRVAEQHGASVWREPWKGHIAQKNSAAAKATQAWILGLDADEVVSEVLQTEITRLFDKPGQAEAYSAYCFPRLSRHGDRWIRHGDWYPDRQTRLWRRGRAQWGGTDPHDRLMVDGPVGRLRGDLLHFTGETIDHQIQKTVTYADTFARQCAASGRRVGFADLFFRPPWRFVRGYGFRLGFLDGWQGLSIAWMGAFYTYLRYAKALELQRQRNRP